MYLKKELYELIRSNEIIFDFIQENALDGLWYWDLEHPENVWMNPKLYSILGYDLSEISPSSKSFHNILAQDNLELLLENLNKHDETSYQPFDQNIRYLHKDGSTVFMRCCGLAIPDKNGNPVRMLGGNLNLRREPELAQAKEKVLNSETQYRTLFENMNTGFVLFEVVQNEKEEPLDLIILAANKSFEKTTGLNLKDCEGQYLTEVLPGIEKDEADWIGTYSKVVLTGEATQFEQGSEKLGHYFSISAFPAGPKQCAVSFFDITERKQAEKKLADSTRYLENLIHYANASIIVWDKDFKIVRVNKAFEDLTGLVATQAIGKKVEMLFPEDQVFQTMDFIKKTTLSYEKLETAEIPIMHLDGSVKIVLWNAANLYEKDGKLIATVVQGVDITQRKKAETKLMKTEEQLRLAIEQLEVKVNQRTALLEAANSELQASNKELEAFSYSVSHDLRAPLRHINGFVELLNQRHGEQLSAKARHYLETISKASKKMGNLIDDLLQYSKTGRKDLRKTELDFNALLKEAMEELEHAKKGREITWNIQELPNVFGDAALLKLVWTNLLENAIKYTRNQEIAKILIGFKEEEENFVFYISDNGVGFDMKYAQKLFGVFQRLHSRSEFEGTGIGLANVQRIIHKHAGRVWAEAEPEKGAKFYFSLPKSS